VKSEIIFKTKEDITLKSRWDWQYKVPQIFANIFAIMGWLVVFHLVWKFGNWFFPLIHWDKTIVQDMVVICILQAMWWVSKENALEWIKK
jgi:hypothetical protein